MFFSVNDEPFQRGFYKQVIDSYYTLISVFFWWNAKGQRSKLLVFGGFSLHQMLAVKSRGSARRSFLGRRKNWKLKGKLHR